ncbi:MAG: hypothetical protein LBT59_30015 [Clostridiales bacterium]|nr:hypothetical protein [Clostridiales bacterium]
MPWLNQAQENTLWSAFAEKYRLDHPGERITIEITPRPYNVILSSGRADTKHYQVRNHKHVVLYDTAKEFFPKSIHRAALFPGTLSSCS